MINKKIQFIMILLIGILMVSLVSAEYSRSSPSYSQYSSSGSFYGGGFDKAMCEQGQDFIITISPFGCTPAVVRSDLLEEQNVPVFCQLSATKLNPIIDVNAIQSISFSGDYPPEVSGIGFHPAKAALGGEGGLNSPVMNNIGYAVIVLRKQPKESEMPDYVSGNLTARISYDIKSAYGVGSGTFYLPEMSDSEWEKRKEQYGFWEGRGYLRAESIDGETAQIIVSNDAQQLESFDLEKGESSPEFYLPGFECLAGARVKLNGFVNPETTAKLKVNSDIVEVRRGERFLDNKCRAVNIEKKGLVQDVTIKCKTDGRKTETFSLSISPRINLSIGGIEREVGIGDWLYKSSDNSKSVYLGYIGTKGNTNNEEDLVVYFVTMPQHKSELGDEDIDYINSIAKKLHYNGITGVGAVDVLINVGEAYVGAFWVVVEYIRLGKFPYRLDYKTRSGIEVEGNKIIIGGFAGAQDVEFDNEDYDSAIDDFEMLRNSFSNERENPEYTDEPSFGERALFEEIKLTSYVGQGRETLRLCEEFKQEYPDSDFEIKSYCEDDYKLSNSKSDSKTVLINGVARTISIEGVHEPGFSEYGASVLIEGPNKRVEIDLSKNEKFDLVGFRDEDSNEYIQLVDLDDDTAVIKINLESEGALDYISKKTLSSNKLYLKKNIAESSGSAYTFTLTHVNLDKLAKVSVIPSVKAGGTEVSFNFRIGIDKRDIQLSPDKIKEKIKSLNETIEKWESISEKLGTVVKGLKTACLGVGAFLTIKNFFANTGGKAISRTIAMRSKGGWYEICTEYVAQGKYVSLDECYYKEADNIEASVNAYYEAMQKQNEEIKALQEPFITKRTWDKSVDTEKFMGVYVSDNYRNEIKENLAGKINTIKVDDVDVDVNKIIDEIESGSISVTDARELQLNARLLSSNDGVVRNIAKKNLESDLGEFWTSVKTKLEIERASGLWGVDASKSVFIEANKDARKAAYQGLTYANVKEKITLGIDDSTPVQTVQTEEGNYLFVLDSSAGTRQLNVDKVYDISGSEIDKESLPDNLKNLYFQKYDKKAYENYFKAIAGETKPMVKYYETEPYKGMPAIVPFDKEKGWYVATRQTLPVGRAIRAYDESGRVSSFWLCNVMENGIAEFKSGIGDDECQQINLGTGQPYNQFYGLSTAETSKLVSRGINAIEQASRQYKAGVSSVVIDGWMLDVGAPAADIPDIQCQDFMSPKDCQLLFNVCDPVICPASRCDFGGAYPVKDVIQSGIIGSIVLCLPNFREGIYIPICLTGIQAGIDGLISIFKSYRDCLQTSLDTGEMVGICDEIYSIHLCEFFWRQAIPLMRIALPKMMEFAFGQNVHGGGEYLGVATAWANAEKSVNYFTQYYAANSYRAFKARSAEDVGTEICENFISMKSGSIGSVLDTLTDPDSPPQFHGRFDEIPFTSATVPPISHYKVFYHIYAGKDSRAYYSVYLRDSGTSSYYQDIAGTRIVASGFIGKGEYATETKDFTAPSGYKEMCINVNGQEECGFKQASTSFAVDYIADKFVEEQAEKTDITSEEECISGTPSAYALVNPNLQAGVEEAISPAIYNRGIIRICATSDPGQSTDAKAGTEESRWKDVGYCGDKKIRCWLDTRSVKNVVNFDSTAGDVLEDVNDYYMDVLIKEGNYVQDFSSEIAKIRKEKIALTRINMINAVIERVFFTHQKATLIFERGLAYAELAKEAYDNTVNEPATKAPEVPVDESENPLLVSGGRRELVLEFQDGTTASNVFYTYYSSEWQWSFREDGDWRSVNDIDDSLTDKDKEFMKQLQNSNCDEGLKLMIQRVIGKDEGSWIFVPGINIIKTEDTEYWSDKITYRIRDYEGALKQENLCEWIKNPEKVDKVFDSEEEVVREASDLFVTKGLVFEFEDGTIKPNVYYNYGTLSSGWAWVYDYILNHNTGWRSANKIEILPEEGNTKIFMKKLQNLDCDKGVREMALRAMRNNEGGWFSSASFLVIRENGFTFRIEENFKEVINYEGDVCSWLETRTDVTNIHGD